MNRRRRYPPPLWFIGSRFEIDGRVDSESANPIRQQRGRQLAFSELWNAIEELSRWCGSMPECDTTGALRGKIRRLEGAIRAAEHTGDLTAVRADPKSLANVARQIHDTDPLTRLVECASRLSEQLAASRTTNESIKPTRQILKSDDWS